MSMATATVETKLITGDELLAMGDIGPCELIDGRIVMGEPAGFKHGRLEVILGAELDQFVRQHKLGGVMGGEVGIYTRRNPDRVRGADIAFISKERLPNGPTGKYLQVAPELVVEIMSPDDRWQEVREKIEEYFAIGVERVWVVEPKNRAVLVFRSSYESRKYDEGDTLVGEGALEGFALPLPDLFAV